MKCEHFFTFDVQLFLKSEWYKWKTFCIVSIQYVLHKNIIVMVMRDGCIVQKEQLKTYKYCVPM